ncbi:MAG TPA: hypothetical protein VID50_10460 [Candidatus Eisenbacteria bacterium]|jgi:hypothetical protein
MKRSRWFVAALALGVLAAGCVLISGQIRITFDLDDFTTSTDSALSSQMIDLNDESEYADNKDKLKDLSDVAVLGEITNTGSADIQVEIWMTPAVTTHSDVSSLKADATARRVWGPFTLKVNETKKVGWDESAKLFSSTGKKLLLDEAKGDGSFTIYAIAAQGTYSFDVSNGILVLVMDVGI